MTDKLQKMQATQFILHCDVEKNLFVTLQLKYKLIHEAEIWVIQNTNDEVLDTNEQFNGKYDFVSTGHRRDGFESLQAAIKWWEQHKNECAL